MISAINSMPDYSLVSGSKKNSKQISFTAGKVDIYSDFDLTYFPGKQSEIKSMSPQNSPLLAKYFNNFRTFLNNTRQGLKFHITSGRTFGEFKTVAWQIKESGFKMPLPDTFIAKNGSDEHIKISSDEEFYNNGKFPFKYDVTNKEKEKNLKDLTNWDGAKIRAKLIELLKAHDFKIVEHDSENCVKDYGDKSLFAHVERDDFPLNPDWKNNKPRSAWIAGLRNDGNSKIYLSYPHDMMHVSERRDVANDISDKLGKFMNEEMGGVKVMQVLDEKGCGGRPVAVLTPKMDESYLYSPASEEESFTLTKLYDTKEAVKRAAKNNDLVIVAGDSSNDFNMLNPAMYIDLPKDVNPKIAMNVNSPKNFTELLQLDAVKDAETIKNLKINQEAQARILKQIEDLPFVGIVVKNSAKNNPIEDIVSAYSKGKYPKIIQVESGHLEDGVRQAIKMYAEKNPEYAKKLSSDLKKEVLGFVEKIEKNNKAVNIFKKI